jgi:hypothetical protein
MVIKNPRVGFQVFERFLFLVDFRFFSGFWLFSIMVIKVSKMFSRYFWSKIG